MAQSQNNINLSSLLLTCMNSSDPMLTMLRWLCDQIMEAEVSSRLSAGKNQHNPNRKGYRCGYRTRRLDTRMGTIYLLVPKVREGGYIPFFVTERKRSETALVQVVQEAFVQGISTRKIEKLAQKLGIENMSHGQASMMAKGLDRQVSEFRTRSLKEKRYPVLWTDALYEKVRVDGRVISMAVIVICGVNEEGKREILAVEPMMEESSDTYKTLFLSLQERGLQNPLLVVSDGHKGIIKAVKESFPGCAWQHCKVHLMRNIMVHVPHHAKKAFGDKLKEIWQASDQEEARKRGKEFCDIYEKRFPKAIEILENNLDESLSYYAYPMIDAKKIASTNMLERLNREIRRRTGVVGIFPNPSSYIRLVSTYLMEYEEDWSTGRCYIAQDSIQELLPA